MRIKKYENWKLNKLVVQNHIYPNQSKTVSIFSLSQLLEGPKRQTSSEDELNENIFTDFNMKVNSTNIHKRTFNKRQIKINQLVQPVRKTERDQSIKNKIKSRLKDQYINEKFLVDSPIEAQQKTWDLHKPTSQVKTRKVNQVQSRVFIKGNNVYFNQFQSHLRSKSSILRRSLPMFNSKLKAQKNTEMNLSGNQKTFRQKFFSVQIKRKNTTSIVNRQKNINANTVKKRHSLKQIQPWEHDEAFQPFKSQAEGIQFGFM